MKWNKASRNKWEMWFFFFFNMTFFEAYFIEFLVTFCYLGSTVLLDEVKVLKIWRKAAVVLQKNVW